MQRLVPIRVDPCSVEIEWFHNFARNEHYFRVYERATFGINAQTIDCLVFFDPNEISASRLEFTSPVWRVCEYALSVEQLLGSAVIANIRNTDPLLILASEGNRLRREPALLSENRHVPEDEQAALFENEEFKRTADFAISKTLVEAALDKNLADRQKAASEQPIFHSHLLNFSNRHSTPWNSKNVVHLPTNHTALQITPPTPYDVVALMSKIEEKIAIHFGIFPQFLSGDIKNVNELGLHLTNKQVVAFVARLRSVLQLHFPYIFMCCFPQVFQRLPPMTRIEFRFSTSAACMLDDLLVAFNAGVLSPEAFTQHALRIAGLIETDENFKANPISENDVRDAEIKGVLAGAQKDKMATPAGAGAPKKK